MFFGLVSFLTTISSFAQESTIAFENVHVIPMDSERVLSNHTVIVRGDRIIEVGPSAKVSVPTGATRVDGRGKYLIPGLAEMHGHVPPPNAPAELTSQTLFLYLANGITTVRGMLGAEGQLRLKERANSGELLSPTLYLAGPSFNGNSVSSPEQAAAMVKRQVEEGWDLLKIHPGITLAEYDAMAKAAHESGIRFGGHVPAEVGIRHAIEMGQETFDHVDGYAEALNATAGPVNDGQLAELVKLTRDSGAQIVPTMALWEVLYGGISISTLENYPELVYVPLTQVQQWSARVNNPAANPQSSSILLKNRIRILGALHKGGVRILMGTDAPQLFSVPGFSLHREFPYMLEAGMTPYEILQSGTTHVGDYFSNKDTFGNVALNHRADLVLLDDNPLEDIAHLQRIAGVMARGRWVPRSELDARVEEIKYE